jgi:hypothetical protein
MNVKAVGWFQNLMYAVLPFVFKCEKWSVCRRECRNFRLIGNKILKRIFGLNFSLPDIIRVVKSRMSGA